MDRDDLEKLIALSIASVLAFFIFAVYMAVSQQNYGPLQPECQNIYQLTTKEVLSCE